MSDELAKYAVSEEHSRGRNLVEKLHPYRLDFERDRDRIIHCSAFRRLEGKTQVFTIGLDDHYRSRMTHTIEVAQIGRTIAKALRLNENLTEAICLAHDLGHPPFGHGGEKVLNVLMADFGGFEHNRQTLRIVDLLEHSYADFVGLNLMYETRLGLARHKSPYDMPQQGGFEQTNCSLEGQAANVADRIAYNCHDLEDGMRAGLIGPEQLRSVEIFAQIQNRIKSDAIDDKTIVQNRTAKAIIDMLVGDCIEASRNRIGRAKVKFVDDVYSAAEDFIVLSGQTETGLVELERFLLQNFYLHKSITQQTAKVKNWLEKLFEIVSQKPRLMPPYFQRLAGKEPLQRIVCDYIAGMTDRFCLKMLEKNKE